MASLLEYHCALEEVLVLEEELEQDVDNNIHLNSFYLVLQLFHNGKD